jgi:hypothetical protein
LKCFMRLLENWPADFEWHSHFNASWVSVEDYQCSRQPSTSKVTGKVEIMPPWRLLLNSPWAWKKMWNEKARTLAQPQLAPSSQQRACPHIPESHRVCD